MGSKTIYVSQNIFSFILLLIFFCREYTTMLSEMSLGLPEIPSIIFEHHRNSKPFITKTLWFKEM